VGLAASTTAAEIVALFDVTVSAAGLPGRAVFGLVELSAAGKNPVLFTSTVPGEEGTAALDTGLEVVETGTASTTLGNVLSGFAAFVFTGASESVTMPVSI